MTDIGEVQNNVVRARADVQRDFEALGRELGRDERTLKSRIHEYAPFLVAGSAALGLLLGAGGPKWIKRVLVVGAIGGIGAAIVKARA